MASRVGTGPVRVGTAPRSVGEASARLLAGVEGELAGAAFRAYRLLHEVALRVAGARGYARGVTQVSFFAPAEVVAHALGVHRATLYRHLPALRALGLLDARAHRTTLNGRTVADGTVWSVKLRPKRGRGARVRIEDLKHKWRDLSADIDRGRTAYRHVRQSQPQEEKQAGVDEVLSWALPHDPAKPPLNMTVARAGSGGLERVLDLPHIPKRERNQAVDDTAKTVAAHLADTSLNYHRWLLWQLLRLHDRGTNHFPQLHLMLQRAHTDKHEGYARNPAALLTSRLKHWHAWEEIRTIPPWRVALRPQETA